ncbi:MAG: hypothetical protein L0Y35_00065 [Flammeovirgaceae bacterium]|nr:hypothetical protein [Flammeovirgaceae bacterium]
MGRNEIRMRRYRMSAGNISRHRNYSALMDQHEKNQRLRRVMRVFMYFLIISFIVIILVIVVRWEKKQKNKSTGKPNPTSINSIKPVTFS